MTMKKAVSSPFYCKPKINFMILFHWKSSLRSKRFRGVFCTKKPIFLFLDAREMGRERKKGGGRGGEREKGNACPQTP